MDHNETASQLYQTITQRMDSLKIISIPEEFIDQLVDSPDLCYERGEIPLAKSAILKLCLLDATAIDRKQLKKYLLSQFNISLSKSAVIDVKERHKWKVRERLLEKSYFWERLSKLWNGERTLPYKVINGIDDDTNETLERIGDPEITSPWFFKGLVMGSVQSGKTTNFSALISKALDLGYGHIIVLAGLTNSLRAQTQKRIDSTITGRDSVFAGRTLHGGHYKVVLYSGHPLRWPISKTSTLDDFSTSHGSEEENAMKEATIFVVKKNLKVLTLLADYLTRLQPLGKLQKPLLLIDDEADNASVNTKKTVAEMTPINNQIRKILASAERKSYIGYTATPFANIFIDPNYESPDDMVSHDLFPKHFIKSLGWPDNYVGAHNLFGEEGLGLKEKTIVKIEQHEEMYLPPNRQTHQATLKTVHKKDIVIQDLPWALEEAIICFTLFCAIQENSNRHHKHASMLINVSRFNLVQECLHRLVSEFIKLIFISANSDSQKSSWEENRILHRLKQTWDRQKFFDDCELDFDQIRPKLITATKSINPVVINTQGNKLEYPDEIPTTKGQRYIVIGGLALSRGLTLEGLAVSYVVRNIGAKDTLLQTARWFGYRDGYENLCRVFLTEKLIEDFEDANVTLNDLRGKLSEMAKMDKTPDDFGLAVMQSEQGLAITARQKMWSAEPYLSNPNLSLRHFQIHQLYNEASSFTSNENSIKQFLQTALAKAIGAPIISNPPGESGSAIFFSSRCLSDVVELLDTFASPMSDMQSDQKMEQHCAVADYIMDRAIEMKEWDIAIPFREAGASDHLLDNDILADMPQLKKLFQHRNKVPRVRLRSNLRLAGADDSILEFTSRNLADSPKSDLVHGFSDSVVANELSHIEAPNGARGADTTAAQILQRRSRPILFIHLIGHSNKNSPGRISDPRLINFGPSGLIASVTIGFPATALPLKSRKYFANVRAQEIRKREFLEATDEAFEEDDEL